MIWVFGVSMIVLAALVFLPARVVAVVAVAMIALHNSLDWIQVPPATAFAGTPVPDSWQKLWLILHQPGFVPLSQDMKLFVAYPLVPWVGVMAAGYALGVVYGWDAERRRRLLLRLGLLALALFVVIRAVNVYGDPQIWTTQPTALFTVLSFLNTTKYPASLLFLLMTLGAALLILAWAEGLRRDSFVNRTLIMFGRVPLFYFILQMFVAHGFGVLLNYLAGKSINYFFLNFPASATDAPADAGFSLPVVYAAWLGGLVLLTVVRGRRSQQSHEVSVQLPLVQVFYSRSASMSETRSAYRLTHRLAPARPALSTILYGSLVAVVWTSPIFDRSVVQA